MIKITKPGQKEFHGFCKWCGCEFTYEISDLKLSATSDKVSCPTCGKDYYHPSMVQDPTIPGGIGRLQTWPPDPIPCTPDMTKTDPCAGCAWRENLLRDGLYIGDTPCTWCNKNKFNNITCSTPPLTGTVQGVSKLATYLTPCIEHLDATNFDDTKCTLSAHEAGATYTIHNDKITTTATCDKVMDTIIEACGCHCGDTEGKATEATIEAALANCNHTKCNDKKNCKGKH